MTSNPLEQLRRALEQGLIDQVTYDAAVAGIQAQLDGGGAIAQGTNALAVGAAGVGVGNDVLGDLNTGRQITAAEGAQVIYAEQGATVVFNDAPVRMKAIDRHSALGRYLQYVIAQNRFLQLHGIRSGGKLVSIELDRIYITLRATREQRVEADWLKDEATMAPGERQRRELDLAGRAIQISVNEALAQHRRLVVLGDPGSGKTTLLRYLALLYARDLADGSQMVTGKLGLAETGELPIFLPLRQIGRFLAEHHGKDDGTDGHALLLRFLAHVLANERIEVPGDFFDRYLSSGHVSFFLDGLDEVADPALRRRVSRMVDSLTRAHPQCRFVLTSRIVGYTDASQLSEGYATTTVREFTIEDIRAFLTQWNRLVAVGQHGPGAIPEADAEKQTRQLLEAIEGNERVRELAINPLLLTVIALVHRDNVKLPDRRTELYREAVDVLLGNWDDARGVSDAAAQDLGFDLSDRRQLLQALALHMHAGGIKEIEADRLHQFLAEQLAGAVPDVQDRKRAVNRFLRLIQERAGLLIARSEASYAFSHLTFQEYLTALALAAQTDPAAHTLRHTGDPWWREVILLTAGHLSAHSKERATDLIRAIANQRDEPVPYHNLVLAAECVRDAGAGRILGDLERELRARLRRELDRPAAGPIVTLLTRGMTATAATKRRIAAAEALALIGGERFWTLPYGEPEWVTIPAGTFTMGAAGKAHSVQLPGYAIARVPVTQAQYQMFVQASGHVPPEDWKGSRPPRGKEAHPVVLVSWPDAMAYCKWLSSVTGKTITLPSEAEWERAARGDHDQRIYPWGNQFDASRCNTRESSFMATTPVGVFPTGASPHGCLDMAGNVWEWTRSVYRPYPYNPADGREAGKVDQELVLRGGSWGVLRDFAGCAVRFSDLPDFRPGPVGFRVVLRCSPCI